MSIEREVIKNGNVIRFYRDDVKLKDVPERPEYRYSTDKLKEIYEEKLICTIQLKFCPTIYTLEELSVSWGGENIIIFITNKHFLYYNTHPTYEYKVIIHEVQLDISKMIKIKNVIEDIFSNDFTHSMYLRIKNCEYEIKCVTCFDSNEHFIKNKDKYYGKMISVYNLTLDDIFNHLTFQINNLPSKEKILNEIDEMNKKIEKMKKELEMSICKQLIVYKNDFGLSTNLFSFLLK